MTIAVQFTCGFSTCRQHHTVVLNGNQVFGGIRAKDCVPLGWQIRTPGRGANSPVAAVAYCPEHRDDIGRRPKRAPQ